jgi:hypothetical protein
MKKGKEYKATLAKFKKFIITHPPLEFVRHIREISFDYLSMAMRSGFPTDFDILLGEMYDLLEVLDCAIDEQLAAKEGRNKRK